MMNLNISYRFHKNITTKFLDVIIIIIFILTNFLKIIIIIFFYFSNKRFIKCFNR